MNTKTTHIIPAQATHPGILIADELAATPELNQKTLATLLGVKPSFLNEIIKGKRPITADMAILLEKSLGISADYWMRFQAQYEIDKARVKQKNIEKTKNIEVWNVVKEYVPVNFFKKQGYLKGDLSADIKTIKCIYNVDSIEDMIEEFSKWKYSLYRKSQKLITDKKDIFAWSALAQYEAGFEEVSAFDFVNLEDLSVKLNHIFYENVDTVEQTKKALSSAGVKLLLIDKPEKTPVDGLSFWSQDNPAIAMTLRHKRIDNFAFTLMHELGHIHVHLRKDKNQRFLDFTSQEKTDKIEMEADQFAQEKLIPEELWNQIKQSQGIPSDNAIHELAERYHINPAIIFGRICFDNDDYAIKTSISKKLN